MSDLFTRPRFFRDVKFHRHTDRAVAWLELFYDLVYVATFIQIGNFLSSNVTWLGFGQFLVLLAVVWWAWTGETFYQNRYYVDDIKHRLLVFGQIFAVATLGLSVNDAFGDLYVQFTIAYVITRIMLVLMYIRAAKAHPPSRAFTRGYVIGFSVGIAIWLGSLLLPAAYHWVGWLIGISVELCVPLLPFIRKHARIWSPDNHHISERFGIFTIIVLGESFVKILDDAQGTAISINEILFSTVGLIVLYSLWWLYFSDTAGKLIDFEHFRRSMRWVYGHFPLAAGLIAFGVGAKKLFAANVAYPADALEPKYRLLYTAAIVLYLFALAGIDLGLENDPIKQSQTKKAVVHLLSAAVVGVIGLTLVGLTPIQFVGLVAIVMVAQVVYTIIQTEKEDGEETAVPDFE
ncbi:low temperature requirement protein A [Candidatus Leptofilum sp.]|uniref:low temperature requirement protein A n=1 Tax=Candidatus Leptofilum sp. TaxID=3241576 RepID=UPI003B5B626B